MAEKTFRVQPGDEIVVEVARRSSASHRSVSSSADRRRGIVEPVRRNEFFPRRLASGIEFYDMGVALDGENPIDKFFAAAANVRYIGTTENGRVVQDDLSPSDSTRRQNALLAVGAENFSKIFKKITEVNADEYRLRLTGGSFDFTLDALNERWRNGAVKLKENETLDAGLTIQGNPFFAYAGIAKTRNQTKVTLLPDFGAPAVDFKLSKSDKFFLLPAFCSASASVVGQVKAPTDRPDLFTQGGADADGYPYSFTETLHPDYLTFPRVFWKDYLNVWFTVDFSLVALVSYSFEFLTYALFTAQSDFLKSFPATRFYKNFIGTVIQHTPDGSIVNTGKRVIEPKAVGSFPQPNLFPPPPVLPDQTAYGVPGQYRAGWSWVSHEGNLLAVVKQGAIFYFVWDL